MRSSVEQKKFDGTPFDTTSPDPVNISVKIPARIQYCKSIRAWVFMHEYIRKSTHHEDSECPWLLRSEETDVYDIEEVQGPWQVWAGVIGKTDGMHVFACSLFGYIARYIFCALTQQRLLNYICSRYNL